MEQANAALENVFSKHAELGRTQQGINELIANSSTVIATCRDDLGYRVNSMDLSKARYMRILTVSTRPGHEKDFAEVAKTTAPAYDKASVTIAWVVYQVMFGASHPTFIVAVPCAR